MDIQHKDLVQLSEVVECIYKGALDPYVWHKTLPIMAEWVGAPMAMLFTPTVLPEDGGFYFNHGIPEEAMELWRVRYQPSDIWTTTAIKQDLLQEGSIFTGSEVVPTEELVRTIWYQEFLSVIGIGQLLTTIVYGLDSSLHHPTALSYFRDLSDAPFNEKDKWKSSLLLPHIACALGIAARLRHAEYRLATSLITLDRLCQGMLLIGEDEEILFSNKAALRILNLDDGLKLQPPNRREAKSYLIAGQRAVQECLDEAIREVVRPNFYRRSIFLKLW
jgi:hypothetical protein